MVKQIVRDVFFLGQPSEPATKADIQDGQHRSASMKLIICPERSFNKKCDFIDWMTLILVCLMPQRIRKLS